MMSEGVSLRGRTSMVSQETMDLPGPDGHNHNTFLGYNLSLPRQSTGMFPLSVALLGNIDHRERQYTLVVMASASMGANFVPADSMVKQMASHQQHVQVPVQEGDIETKKGLYMKMIVFFVRLERYVERL